MGGIRANTHSFTQSGVLHSWILTAFVQRESDIQRDRFGTFSQRETGSKARIPSCAPPHTSVTQLVRRSC